MFARVRQVHDSTIDKYRGLGMNNSTIGWVLFTEGLFVLFVGIFDKNFFFNNL